MILRTRYFLLWIWALIIFQSKSTTYSLSLQNDQLQYILQSTKTNPIVQIPNGKLQGLQSTNSNNKNFYRFQKIPFAKPPLKELRFKAPVEPDDWSGILDAKNKDVMCGQIAYQFSVAESEDCLYLNVYTPQLPIYNKNISLPVMVYIFGGAFLAGNCLYNTTGPEYFMDYDVILVTINYRVGAFGFLSTEDQVIPGNYGLKDQHMALKWVNKNIKYFGGDPTKVTLFGWSAGSASVAYHLLNKKSIGLFRSAILESGSALCPWALRTNARKYAFQTGSNIDPSIDMKNTSSKKLLEVLTKASFVEIKNASAKINSEEYPPNSQFLNGFYYAPVIEPEHSSAFITKSSYKMLKSGNAYRVPIMMGFTDEELIFNAYETEIRKIWDKTQYLVPDDMHLKNDTLVKKRVSKLIHQFYVGNGSFEKNLVAGVKYWSNDALNRAILKHAEFQSRFSDVYFYQFAYFGKLGGFDTFIDGAGRVQHGAELNYLFHMASINLTNYSKEDVLMHRRLLTLWTNFAKYLLPTPVKSPLLQNVIWPKIGCPNSITYLNINSTMSIKTNPKNRMHKFWNELYSKFAILPLYTF